MMNDSVSSQTKRPHIAVIGGGVSGLMCARTLSRQGARVTLFEASEKIGGQIKNISIQGQLIDVGAEAIHLSAPGMQSLLEELGLAESLIHSNPGMAWLWGKNGLRPLPSGVGPSGPRRLLPVLRARVLTLGGLMRAGLEPIIPRTKINGDIAVGTFLQKRFGREVVDRLLDPILGSLHAGNVYKLSLKAVAPELAKVADSGRSIMMSRKGKKTGAPMSFATWPDGLTSLATHLLDDTDVTVRADSPVTSIIFKSNTSYELQFKTGSPMTVDGLVLAVPARIAAVLLQTLSPEAGALLKKIRYASVATTILVFPKSELNDISALSGTGLLVPSSKARILKAATFLTRKWPHLAVSPFFFLRLSSGRIDEQYIDGLDDSALVARLRSDLKDATGITASPTNYHVQRWPDALPQLEVKHMELIADVRKKLNEHPAIALAGASYDGIGISSCLRSGERAALACLATINVQDN